MVVEPTELLIHGQHLRWGSMHARKIRSTPSPAYSTPASIPAPKLVSRLSGHHRGLNIYIIMNHSQMYVSIVCSSKYRCSLANQNVVGIKCKQNSSLYFPPLFTSRLIAKICSFFATSCLHLFYCNSLLLRV